MDNLLDALNELKITTIVTNEIEKAVNEVIGESEYDKIEAIEPIEPIEECPEGVFNIEDNDITADGELGGEVVDHTLVF